MFRWRANEPSETVHVQDDVNACILCMLKGFSSPDTAHIQYNLDGSNSDGSFILDDSNSFLSP